MTAGASIPPWWTGAIGSAAGLQTALRLNALMLAPLLAICFALARRERKGRGQTQV
jgi:hypothetical protein